MDLQSWISARGGWAHRADALDAGWTRYRIEQALRAAIIVASGRHWLHLPSVPGDLRLAIGAGARVTCVSAARMLGLWIPSVPEHVHVSVHPHAGRDLSGFVVHRNLGPVTASARNPIDAIENVLARVATCLPRVEALSIWESAIAKRLVSIPHLQAVGWTTRAARDLAGHAHDGSDSGLETIVVHRLARIGISALQQVPLLGHRVDVLVGHRLVIQLDGWAHHQGAQRRSDIAHDRRLRLAGYTVLRFDYHEIMENWPVVERQIVAAVAQGLHRAQLSIRPRRVSARTED